MRAISEPAQAPKAAGAGLFIGQLAVLPMHPYWNRSLPQTSQVLHASVNEFGCAGELGQHWFTTHRAIAMLLHTLRGNAS